MFLLLVVISILCGLIFQLKRYGAVDAYPGPSLFDVLKLSFSSKSGEDIYRNLEKLSRKHGTVVKVWVKPFRPALLVSNPKFVEHILWSKEHLYKTQLYDIFSEMLGDGLGQIKDLTTWKRERKIFTPVFNYKTISQYSLKLNYHAKRLKAILESRENELLNVQPIMHHCTLDMIIEYLTDEHINEHTAADIMVSLQTHLEIVFERAFSFYKRFKAVFRYTKRYKTWQNCIGTVDTYVNTIARKQIDDRKINIRQNLKFLDVSINECLSYTTVISHLKTFIAAGFETTGQGICFALFELAKRPDIQEKMYNEYTSIIGTDKSTLPTFDTLKDMVYVDCVIKETLRLYPPVPMLQRRLKAPVCIDGVTIPSGVDLIFSIITLHKSPRFDRPLEFDPDRFLPENIDKIPAYCYVPFSVGPRDCIGKKLALLEMKFLLSFIVRHFTLHPAMPEHKLNLVVGASLHSRNGVPLIFKRRK